MRPVAISNRLTRALINMPTRTGFERPSAFEEDPAEVRARLVKRICAARGILADELRLARSGAHAATAKEIRAWAAWIGYPVLIASDRRG